MTEEELTNSLRVTRSELEQVKAQLDELQGRTSVISKSFLKRAFAIYGHTLVAGLIVSVPIWIMMMIFFVAAGMLAAAAH